MRATRREKNGKDKGKAMSAMWLTRHTARDTRMNSRHGARLIRVDDDRRAEYKESLLGQCSRENREHRRT